MRLLLGIGMVGAMLAVSACSGGPVPYRLDDGGMVWPDGGVVVDGGVEDGGFPLCFFARADRLTAVATQVYASPSDAAKVVTSLPSSALVIPLANDSSGKSCQDGGYLEVQHLKAKGWVRTEDTQDSTCHKGSPFDADIDAVIESVFGTDGAGAVVVSRCESKPDGTSAKNPNDPDHYKYFGLFQMGPSERSTWGDSICAEGQSVAANAYFVATGSDWSPWTCKPDGGK